MKQRFFLFLLIFGSAFCFAKINREKNHFHIVSEKTENENYRYKVIEMLPDLENNQNQISQRKVLEVIGQWSKSDLLQRAEELSQKRDLNLPLHELSLDQLAKPAKEPLWVPVKLSWTQEDEKDYSQWIKVNGSTDFNERSNLFADCADIGLLFRWAYAHDKKLPIANTLSGSGKLFGHFSGSAAWDPLPTAPSWRDDERFKVAMRYLFDNTYTHSIYKDLYPTEINNNYVRPGSMYMIIREESGHTQTLSKFDQSISGIISLWVTEPASERISETWLIWEPAVKNLFGSWRWPQFTDGIWSLVQGNKMPGYSLIQFEMRKEFNDEEMFELWVLSQLGMKDFDSDRLKRNIQNLVGSLSYRLQITALGATICGYNSCDKDSSEYDSYSTNFRDARLRNSQYEVLSLVDKMGGVQSRAVQEVIDYYQLNRILISGYQLSYKDFIFSKERMDSLASDANLSLRERWGLPEFQNSRVEFSFLNSQLKFAISERQDLFESAYSHCFQSKCDPDESYVKQLNTLKMDRGLPVLAQRLDALRKAPELVNEVDFLKSIMNPYRRQFVSYNNPNIIQSPLCKNRKKCTLYDVIWSGEALLKVNRWKSQPMDPLIERWGL